MDMTRLDPAELVAAVLAANAQRWFLASDLARELGLDQARVRRLLPRLAAEGRAVRNVLYEGGRIYEQWRAVREAREET
jgi:hypothetical protein